MGRTYARWVHVRHHSGRADWTSKCVPLGSLARRDDVFNREPTIEQSAEFSADTLFSLLYSVDLRPCTPALRKVEGNGLHSSHRVSLDLRAGSSRLCAGFSVILLDPARPPHIFQESIRGPFRPIHAFV